MKFCCGQDLSCFDTSNWNTEFRTAGFCTVCWHYRRGRKSWKKQTDLSNLTGLPYLYKTSVWLVSLLSGLYRKVWQVTSLIGLDRKLQ